jgi:hypothetical protein
VTHKVSAALPHSAAAALTSAAVTAAVPTLAAAAAAAVTAEAAEVAALLLYATWYHGHALNVRYGTHACNLHEEL